MRAVALVLLLAGCATPSPRFIGAETTDVRVGGYDFTLHRKGRDVELVRHSLASPAERARLLTLMPAIIEAQTQCEVLPSSLNGDAGVVRARLRC